MIVEGRVQGVGFRWFVQQKAKLIGVVGHVRNRSDGRVEVEAEGEKEQLLQLQKTVSAGPSFSKVTNVVVDDIMPTGKYKTFEITF